MTAKELHDRQRHYDILHHRKRIDDIDKGLLDHLGGKAYAQEVREASVRCVEKPCLGYRSVNLDDAGYIAELDRFAVKHEGDCIMTKREEKIMKQVTEENGLKETDLHVLWHTLGVSAERQIPYRNHFMAGEGHHDMPSLDRLCAAGFLRKTAPPNFTREGDMLFVATIEGRNIAIATLPTISKGKRCYRAFRDLCDCIPDLTFREFLVNPEYAPYR